MYGYLIKLYSKLDPIKTINKINTVELLPSWNYKYLQLIGFVKYGNPIPIHDLEKWDHFNILRGTNPVFIEKNGNPKILRYKVKSVERIEI